MLQVNRLQLVLSSLKVTMLAGAMVAVCPLVVNAGGYTYQGPMSPNGGHYPDPSRYSYQSPGMMGHTTTEVPPVNKVYIRNNDEYLLYQDLGFINHWQNYARHILERKEARFSHPGAMEQYHQNQMIIARLLGSAQGMMEIKNENISERQTFIEELQRELEERYNQCVMRPASLADVASGIAALYGLFSTVTLNLKEAVLSFGCSGGLYLLSNIMKEVEIHSLKKALEESKVEYKDITDRQSPVSYNMERARDELQQARTLVLHNIALRTGGDRLNDQRRRQAVGDLFQDSQYRHMQPPMELANYSIARELYGVLSSQVDDDAFILAIGGERPDSSSAYKLLRCQGRFYIPAPFRGQVEYLEFEKVESVLAFITELAEVHHARGVGFINLDPVPSSGIR
ncbi:hypothetical protein M3P05_04495 [Sansalvadorimonas sp. 2012CJ34-2]|uniref:Uncharacterized protein n=1 Tax=Parendozoicomonas callyspongiae TaxID=2942213 RepID=A0ABT0PF90_9GAMM|nr:hypothetical protein [Sansalvadorimonas sp. 2012CJ34-2]MCL6269203.1 hypothetical protein [Sansalvadorimonas sp. 2012CJ34-2]